MAWRTLFVSLVAAALASSAAACSGNNTAPGDDAGACTPLAPPTMCPSPPPSYKNEIQFIVASHCAEAQCHTEGGAEAVKDFSTYQGLVADHLTVEYEVAQCPSSPMPPPGYPPLTAAQRLELAAWAGICRAPNN
jgi:hypothetical protein